MARRETEAGEAPGKGALHEAALAALGRRAMTATTLTQALERRVATWARRAQRAGRAEDEIAESVARAREQIAEVVARMIEVGLVNDARFAEARAARLVRQGRSRRAISAHLAAKGVDQATAREALGTDPDTELTAAVALTRKKRLGAFAREAADAAGRRKELAALARAGFELRVAERALRMDREEAEERLARQRW